MFKWTRFSPDILKLLVFQPYSQVINGLRHDKRDIRTFRQNSYVFVNTVKTTLCRLKRFVFLDT